MCLCRKRRQICTGEATPPARDWRTFGLERTLSPFRKAATIGSPLAREGFPRFPLRDRERTGGAFPQVLSIRTSCVSLTITATTTTGNRVSIYLWRISLRGRHPWNPLFVKSVSKRRTMMNLSLKATRLVIEALEHYRQ